MHANGTISILEVPSRHLINVENVEMKWTSVDAIEDQDNFPPALQVTEQLSMASKQTMPRRS